ncbi:MAG: arginine--tRNA ligase [Deltaproteobacteria bacterium]|nr:arginine--tRNA ligase [Deltaproteobacteria bacterium]
MEYFKEKLVETAASMLGLPAEQISRHLRVPETRRGDLALPCFPFAKTLKKNPNVIARDLALQLDNMKEFSAKPEGPYVNVTINPRLLVINTINEILSKKTKYGHQDIGSGKALVIDFSSPNIAKPIAFHHIRSTVTGMALCRLSRAMGYNPVGINYLGDWGKQFGLLALAFKTFGEEERLEKEGIRYLVQLYARANMAAKGDPKKGILPEQGFDERARNLFSAMENGDKEVIDLWKRFRDISLEEFDKIYSRLGVTFDHVEGESKYVNVLDSTIDKVRETVGVRISQGALVADIEYDDDEPPFMLRKADGSTLYGTRDIAAAMDRFNRFEFAKSLYVVGAQQRLYFTQLFRCLKAMGFEWADRCIHVPFGTVLKKKPDPENPGGYTLERFATRRGEIIYLEEVIDEAVAKAVQIMKKTNPELGENESKTVAEQVGVAAVMFSELSHRRSKDIAIETDENDYILWEKLIDFRGQTGPYLQYAHARSCSIMRKGGGPPGKGVDLSLLTHPAETALVKELAAYPSDLKRAFDEYEPAILADRLIAVGRAVSYYYTLGNQDRDMRILCKDKKMSNARLALVEAVRLVLRGGLELLGIPVPERM